MENRSTAEKTSWFQKHPLAVYLILANGITWLCWLPGMLLAYRQGFILPNFDTYDKLFQIGFANRQQLTLAILFQLGVYGPLIAAIIATWLDSGRDGLLDLWERIKKADVGGRWYLIILGIACLLPAIPVGMGALSGVVEFSSANALTLPYLLFVFFAQFFTSGIGEEPGWRGFLLPRLKARFDGQKYIWLLGVIWAIWHYPFTIFVTLTMVQDISPAQTVMTILSSLAGNTMGLIGMTFLFVWVYNQTKSVFLSIVFHALVNVVPLYVFSFLTNPQMFSLFIGIMPWVIVFILQVTLGKERFPEQIAPA